MGSKVKNVDVPDVAKMLNTVTLLERAIHGSTGLLASAIRERLTDMSDMLEAGNNMLRKQVLVALIDLNSLDGISPESEATNSDVESELLGLFGRLRAAMEKIDGSVKAVTAWRVPVMDTLEADSNNEFVKLKGAVEQLKELLVDKEHRLGELRQLVALMEKPSVSSALKKMVPEAKDIDHIVNAVTDPTVSKELLKDALVKFNSYVEFIEGGRKYADVLQTKLALEQSIDETRGSLANLEQRMAATQKTVSQYVQVYEADALRQQWLKEAGTFFDGWRGLERTLVDAREVLALYQALLSARDYLLEVRRCFEAA